jgi:tetratricopeptide (TPR) repeat protein
LGLYKDAIEACKQAIYIDPDYVYSHFVLGLSYFLIGDKSSALNEYKILKNLDINKANELFDLIY